MLKTYSSDWFKQNGLDFNPVETLFITSKKSVVRGLHFQGVKQQPKLVRCVIGSIWCAIVDLRTDSHNFGLWISVEINENSKQGFMYLPDVHLVRMHYRILLLKCNVERNSIWNMIVELNGMILISGSNGQ